MTRTEKNNLKVRILRLARLKSTGSPADLASRFDMSERNVKRLIHELRQEGYEIRYCPVRRSYVLEAVYQYMF